MSLFSVRDQVFEINAVLTTPALGERALEVERQVREYTVQQIEEMQRLHDVVQTSMRRIRRVPVEREGPRPQKISADTLYQSVVKKTNHGGSGFTFVFNMVQNVVSTTFMTSVRGVASEIAAQIEASPAYAFTQRNVKLIFKWALKEDQYVQAIYNCIYRRCGFLSPHSFFPEDRAQTIRKICNVATGNKLCLPSSMALTAVVGFRGANLEEARNGGAFSSYSEEDWKQLFLFLGKVTVLDMLLGNHDRVIRFDTSSQQFVSHWNLANVMLDLETRTFFAIDNGIDIDLLPKEKEKDDGYFQIPGESLHEAVESPPEPPCDCFGKVFCLTRYFHAFSQCYKSEQEFLRFSTLVVTSFFKEGRVIYPNQPCIIEAGISAWKQGVYEMVDTLKKDQASFMENASSSFRKMPEGNVAFREELLRVIFQNLALL